MRHRKAKGKLGRHSAKRKALMRTMASSLIERQRITTTVPKAKVLASFMGRIITLGKKNTPTARKNVISILGSKRLINRLFDEIAPLFAGRNGGYTRIMRIGNRRGDNAPMAVIELTEKIAEVKKPGAKKSAETKARAPGQPDGAQKPKRSETPKPERGPEKDRHKDDREKLHKGFMQGLKKYFRGGKKV